MTNADPEYRRFQFTIADILAIMVIVAVLGGFRRLPIPKEIATLAAVPPLVVLYLTKFRIARLCVRPLVAFLLYLAVVVALSSYLYYCTSISTMTPLAFSMFGPIAAFTVPTASFLYDVLAHKRPSAWFYVLRSLAEIVILVPIWLFVWAFLVALLLFGVR